MLPTRFPRWQLALVILILGGGQGPSPKAFAGEVAQMVVLATVGDVVDGRKEAIRAADRLGYAVAEDTLTKPPARRVYVGEVITLQRAKDARFLLTSFLGNELAASVALKKATKHYPSARIVNVVLPPQNEGEPDEWLSTPSLRLGVLVAGSFAEFEAARRFAATVSRKTGHPYSSRGMIHEKKRGLIWPDDAEDEAWAGAYAPRRFDNECDGLAKHSCITIERSEAYEGFKPGLYIVVVGILGREHGPERRLSALRDVVPDAYLKRTTIYLGCTH